MSNTERKARKRAGVQFKTTPKAGTPFADRAPRMVYDRQGKAVGPMVQHTSQRYAKQLKHYADAVGGKLRWAK